MLFHRQRISIIRDFFVIIFCMTWNLVASGKLADSGLELFERDGEYMMRVNGWELMNSLCHRSEKALAEAARKRLQAYRPKILIGGLGLGYTLEAFLDRFPGGDITVAEISEDVLSWYRRYFQKHEEGDDRVSIRLCDVQTLLGTKYDAVVLDVDNGPQAISLESNSDLYTESGLRRIAASLNYGGMLVLWSSFASEEFVSIARKADFHVECHPISIGRGEHQHFIYECSPDALRRPTPPPVNS